MIEAQDISTSIAQDLHRLLVARNEITTIEINALLSDINITDEIIDIKSLLDSIHRKLTSEINYHKSSRLSVCSELIDD